MKSRGILANQLILVQGFYTYQYYPKKIRRITFYDEEQNRVLVFLTKNLELDATEISKLYKHRWKMELFFKWIAASIIFIMDNFSELQGNKLNTLKNSKHRVAENGLE
ncbi:MAG: transposase [Microcystis sp. M065S1]|nr:transposase [Microcystis sp. M065S1]